MMRLFVALVTALLLQSPAYADTVTVDTPSQAWGMRRIAHYVEKRVPELDIRFAPCEGAGCIQVTVADFGPRFRCLGARAGYYFGCANLGGPRVVLNTHYRKRQAVACHEFMHALGIRHHERAGCAGRGARYPSHFEIKMLRKIHAAE